MVWQQEITVRRAKPGDAGGIAAFINRAWRGRLSIDELAVIERLGSVGFLLVERGGDLVGLLGWQVENLVVSITDFLVGSVSERVVIGQALLVEMEKAAGELQCEAALLFPPRPTPPALVEFYQTLGYEAKLVVDLPLAWRETAQQGQLGDDDMVLVKLLSDRRVLRPL